MKVSKLWIFIRWCRFTKQGCCPTILQIVFGPRESRTAVKQCDGSQTHNRRPQFEKGNTRNHSHLAHLTNKEKAHPITINYSQTSTHFQEPSFVDRVKTKNHKIENQSHPWSLGPWYKAWARCSRNSSNDPFYIETMRSNMTYCFFSSIVASFYLTQFVDRENHAWFLRIWIQKIAWWAHNFQKQSHQNEVRRWPKLCKMA